MSKVNDKSKLLDAVNGMFDKYDTNKNGYLELSEVSTLLRDTFDKLGRNYEEKDIIGFVNMADKNKDGKVSKK